MWILNCIFYIVAFLLIISSLVVVLAKNPMTAVLALVFVFVNTSFLFVLMRAEFLAMIMLIVYVGAILVLFIFIIMLLKIKVSKKRKIFTKPFILGIILGTVIFIEIAVILKGGIATLPYLNNMKPINDLHNSYNLALELYNNFYTLIIVLGVLLTVVIVGIIYIFHEENEVNIYKQKMGLQTQRDPKTSVKLIKVDNEKGIE